MKVEAKMTIASKQLKKSVEKTSHKLYIIIGNILKISILASVICFFSLSLFNNNDLNPNGSININTPIDVALTITAFVSMLLVFITAPIYAIVRIAAVASVVGTTIDLSKNGADYKPGVVILDRNIVIELETPTNFTKLGARTPFSMHLKELPESLQIGTLFVIESYPGFKAGISGRLVGITQTDNYYLLSCEKPKLQEIVSNFDHFIN